MLEEDIWGKEGIEDSKLFQERYHELVESKKISVKYGFKKNMVILFSYSLFINSLFIFIT
jgi:hypothetical protein